MVNIPHASMTGAELHEPKGADTAALGTVYVANGAGSGSWSAIGTSSFTGMIADFAAPVAPTGWLELDGSTISTSTYSALYAVMSITTSGTRSNGNPVITSIPDTSNLRVGYYVFGTGIASGTTILSIDSSSQITLSGNASSSGSSSFAVSPWVMNTGTIQLPDMTTAGRYRRSRTASTKVGDVLADTIKGHTHSVPISGTTSAVGGHVHGNFLTDPGHTHIYSRANLSSSQTGGGGFAAMVSSSAESTTGNTTGISLTNAAAGEHSHSFSSTATAASDGTAETRPVSAVFLTCVKT